jgi:hypothetical protein
MVDWSKYNGKTNLKATVDEFGIVALMARCTIGHAYVDPYYYHNFQQARDLGVLFGAYHVLRPQERAPAAEVAWFKKYMTLDGEPPDFAVGDCELPNKPIDWKLITPKEAGQVITATFYTMRASLAIKILTYTGSWWWNGKDHLGSVTPLGMEKDFPLIEAEYLTLATDRGRVEWDKAPEAPRLPSPGRGWKPEDIVSWQWTDGLRGVGCGPDGNKYMDGQVLIPTYDEFLALIGKTHPVSDKAKLDRLWEHHPELHSIL